jgi:hypothetical protein
MASKRVAQSRGPLDSEAVVQQVLSYVGPGQWLICGLISKKWRELYAEVQSIEQEVYDRYDRPFRRTITARMTTYSAVFASASRVELASKCGLKLRSREKYLQRAAARYGDAETLITARKLGMPWSDGLINSIAEQGDLPKLQALDAKYKCRLPVEITAFAASSGSVDMLKWLKQKGCAFSADTAREAALGGHQEVIMYLHAGYWHSSWDATACSAASKNCHVPLLCWLVQQKCKYDGCKYDWLRAVQQNKVDAMECFCTTGWAMPSAAELTQLLNRAGAHSSLAACQWLREHGAE